MWIYQRSITGIWANMLANKIQNYVVVYVDSYDDYNLPHISFKLTSTLKEAYQFYVGYYEKELKEC